PMAEPRRDVEREAKAKTNVKADVEAEREPTLFAAEAADDLKGDREADRFVDGFHRGGHEQHLDGREPELVEPPEPSDRRPLGAGFERLPAPIGTSHATAPPEKPMFDAPDTSRAMFDAPESSRPGMLPVAIAAIIGLLGGFAGGYFVGSRDR